MSDIELWYRSRLDLSIESIYSEIRSMKDIDFSERLITDLEIYTNSSYIEYDDWNRGMRLLS